MIAAAVEEVVHRTKTDAEYKQRMRTIIFNLKDKKNPELRRRVVLGEISPEDFAVMSSEDMASDKKQDEIKRSGAVSAISWYILSMLRHQVCVPLFGSPQLVGIHVHWSSTSR